MLGWDGRARRNVGAGDMVLDWATVLECDGRARRHVGAWRLGHGAELRRVVAKGRPSLLTRASKRHQTLDQFSRVVTPNFVLGSRLELVCFFLVFFGVGLGRGSKSPRRRITF